VFTPSSSMWEARSAAATVPFRITLATVAAGDCPSHIGGNPRCSLPLLQCGRRAPPRRLSRSGSPSLPSRRGPPLPHWRKHPSVHSLFNVGGALRRGDCPVQVHPRYRRGAERPSHIGGNPRWSPPLLQCGRRTPCGDSSLLMTIGILPDELFFKADTRATLICDPAPSFSRSAATRGATFDSINSWSVRTFT